ncbi:MAG: glycosyltransferase family 4 protein [Flavobacterium sp.]|nr:glycosyltransferase family 4 protein [Flavobacterium sp.]
MRILLVIDSFFTGGAEFSTLELFNYLKEKNVVIQICKLKKMNPEYAPETFHLSNNIISTLPNGTFLEKRKALKKIITEFNPDIIHSVLFNANLLVRSIRVFDSSFVHIESLVNHTYSENRLQEKGVTKFKLEGYRILDRITSVLGTDHFHPNGYSVAKHYHEKLGIAQKKMTVVHRGRDIKKYDVLPFNRKEIGIDEDKIILLNVARQEYQKGQDILLKALTLLPKDILEKVHLLIVGREGKLSNELFQFVKENKLEEKVTFLGHRTAIPELLKMSNIFVFPSRFEGLPGVLIEAEAAGLPIICTDLSMMKEVVSVNQNAFVFELDNEKQLAACISKLVLDDTIRNRFALESKNIFNQKFQIETIHQKMFDLYNKLLSK